MDRTINTSQIFDISLQKMWKSLWANCFSKLSLDFGDNFIEWLHFAQPPRGASMGSGLKILVSRPFRTPNNAIESWVAGKFKIDGVSLVCLLHTLNVKLFSGAKIDFLPFLKWQKMCFCTFEIALFSNFRALCSCRTVFLPSINTRCQKWLWNHSQISWASSFEDVSLGRDLQLLMQHYSTISQTWLFHQTKIWWQANEYQRGPWK